MAGTIRLHLDEHVARSIAEGLRRRGIDTTTTLENGLCSASDREQLEFASTNDRAIVTSDADFLRLHAQGVGHSGIFFLPHKERTVREALRLLIIACSRLSTKEMIGHVEYL